MVDEVRFLDPWTLMLPEDSGSVLAVAGSGGKTTVLLRLLRHYREHGATVLWTQTVEHAAPFDLPPAEAGESAAGLRERLQRDGSLFIAGERTADSRFAGLSPERVESLRRTLRPDITLVEAHAACHRPLRRDHRPPRWPPVCRVAFLVGHLAAVGRLWGATSVAGIQEQEEDPETAPMEPRRVTTDDVLEPLLDDDLLAGLSRQSFVVPFLTGFGAYRDIDSMFALVGRLLEHDRVKLVCLAELLGDPRRDAADLAGLGAAAGRVGLFSSDRVYALYPASLESGPPDD